MTGVTDMLSYSGVLRQGRMRREEFDSNNRDHLESLRTWLISGNWGDVQFYCEAPCLNVPETVLRKMADAGLSALGV